MKQPIKLLTLAVLLLVVGALAAAQSATQVETRAANTRLFSAVKSGSATGVRAAIRAGANVNVRGEHGMTALIYAAYKPNLDVVQVLIAAGADVNAANNDGMTALMVARAYNKNPDVEKALIAAGAEENFWRNRR